MIRRRRRPSTVRVDHGVMLLEGGELADQTAAPLGGLEHSQLKDRVYHYLREAIIGGEFEVGAALREHEVCARLGVSKTPVREAFVRLENDRLLELIPYKGAVVSGYTTEDLREFYEVRELVEGACARMAAESSSPQLRRELQDNVARSTRAFEQDDFDAVIRLFEQFDDHIYRQSTNRWIDTLVENLEGHQRRIGLLTVKIPGRLSRSIKQHKAIAAAIGRSDGDGAERLMREHVRSVMEDQLRSS